jgi:enolase
MTAIIDIVGREILDSRGNPTVEVDVTLEDGRWAAPPCPRARPPGRTRRSSCATATSQPLPRQGRSQGRGCRERANLRRDRRHGREDQRASTAMIELDGTPTRRLGANAILGVSLAVAKAAPMPPPCRSTATSAAPRAHVLPVPMMNIINGGAHADNPIDIQEFMIMPVGADSCADASAWAPSLPHAEEGAFADAGHNTNVGDEGGFAPESEVDPTRRSASS